MKKLLKRLTSDYLFSINGKLLKQIDGCSMGSPLLVDIAGAFMTKVEKEVVYPTNPILFKRYVDDIFNRKKKREKDKLLPKLNNYHPTIKFAFEVRLSKFLDTKLKLEEGKYMTSVNRNNQLPTHWGSKIPKKMNRNIITNDLHRAKEISTDFPEEVKEIENKYKKAGYPERYVKGVIKDFREKAEKIETEEKEADERAFRCHKITIL